MWQIENRTPYKAERGWIRDKNGAEVWVVAVKATYTIGPDGKLSLSDEQSPVYTGPVPRPDSKSLLYETDLGPPKRATDVILNGHAYVQSPRPAKQLHVGFKVGPIVRTALIFGDRQWQKGLLGYSPGEPEPFLHMPLLYERALGGGTEQAREAGINPAGCGLMPDQTGRMPMPNIEHLEKRLTAPHVPQPVIGFGAVPCQWPWRSRYGGTYDAAWEETRRPLLPEDFDERYWQIAPPEQQAPGHLKGGEAITLVNLTPPGFAPEGQLHFTLPTLTLRFETRFYDNSVECSSAVLHTVILEPDHPRISIVHHMALPCHPKVNLLERTVISEKKCPCAQQKKGGKCASCDCDCNCKGCA